MQKKRFKIDIAYRLECVKKLSEKYGWKILYSNSCFFICEITDSKASTDGKVTMKIILSNMNVFTTMKHPKKGLNTLERKNVSSDIIKQLFANPRKHTNLKSRYHTVKKQKP